MDKNQGRNFAFKTPVNVQGGSFIASLLIYLENRNKENAIESELKRLRKVSNGITPEITTRLRYQIISVDGNDDKEYVNKFIKNEFFAIDSKSFRDYYSKIVPDVNFDSGFLCAICDWSGEVDLPITTNFFWPSR